MPRETLESAAVDLAESIRLLVRRVRAAGASDDLSWTEMGVLKRLAKEGPATTADLARAQGMRPQSMRTIVASLEEMRLVERKPHATDGRQVNLALTAKGAAVEKRAGDRKRTWLTQAIAALDEREQEKLFAAGKIIRRLLESDPQ
jgi:DNA-binding MarR family transcriptional regulator